MTGVFQNGYRVRNLKFPTYLKFATCGITNKLSLRQNVIFFTELTKVFRGGEFYIPYSMFYTYQQPHASLSVFQSNG